MQQEGPIGDSKNTHLLYNLPPPKDIHIGRSWMPGSTMHQETPTGWSKRVETETRRAVMGLKGESGRPHSLSHFQPLELAHAAAVGWSQCPLLHSAQHYQKTKSIYFNFWGKHFQCLQRPPPHTPFFFFPIVFLGFFVLVLPINAYHSLKQLDSEAQE